MNRSTPVYLLAIIPLLWLSNRAMGADDTNSTAKAATSRFDYQSFRIISERNIFNPNRSPRGGDRNFTRNREPERRGRPSPAFGLIGTMSYEKGPFAVFDGTSSDYRKVLQPDDSIAGFKVTEIAPSYVTLQGNGKEVHLEVGGRMRKQQESDWAVSANNGESFESFISEGSDTSTNEGPSDASSTNAASTAAPTGEVSDILKRLMQKREQELR